MVEHEANSVNLVERLHSSDKLMEQVDYLDRSVKHVKSLSSSEFKEEELLIQRLEIEKRDLQQSIERENSVNDKSTTKTTNQMSNKSAKEKNKFANKDAKTERTENKLATSKVKYKSTIDKVKGKSVMKKAKNLTIHERDKHNVRRVIARWKS
ncbi:hypothetical protein DEO72_LG1g3302 [Vigna unguiculata]|uniref:Uncharacterized protein n=1 Tax=Vigna unguiculata TaxID=3917 RepID=A0A4D6KNI3_VIGUN|nr:hypothetical protein DEO72_LG1g3302 [Vigna unguiculata]